MSDKYDVILENEGVRISHAYVVYVQYEKATDSSRKWLRVSRCDGTDLILPVQAWDDITVNEISAGYFAVSVKVDWTGSVMHVGSR